LNRNERSHWSGNGVHVESELVFMIGRNMQQKRQDQLFSEWEHLKRLALQSVQQYLKDGGDGAAIPETFQVVTDQHNGVLNNFSARFWLVPSPPQ